MQSLITSSWSILVSLCWQSCLQCFFWYSILRAGSFDFLYLRCSLSCSTICGFKSGVIQGQGFPRIRFVIIGAMLSRHDLMIFFIPFQAKFTLVAVRTVCQSAFLNLPHYSSLSYLLLSLSLISVFPSLAFKHNKSNHINIYLSISNI